MYSGDETKWIHIDQGSYYSCVVEPAPWVAEGKLCILKQDVVGSAPKRMLCALAPGGSWPPSSTEIPGGRFWVLVRRHLQLRQAALGDVNVEVLDTEAPDAERAGAGDPR